MASEFSHIFQQYKDKLLSQDKQTRYNTLDKLVSIDRELTLDHLIDLTDVEITVNKGFIIELMGSLNSQRAFIVLAEMLSTKGKSVHHVIVSTLQRNLEQVETIMIDKLNESDPVIKANVLKILSKSNNMQIAQHILPFLNDGNETVRFYAVVALSNFVNREPHFITPLLSCLSDNSMLVRSEVIKNLGYYAEENNQIASSLINHYNENLHKIELSALIYSLGDTKDKNAVEVLLEVLKNSSYSDDIRSSAAMALARLGKWGTEALKGIINESEDSLIISLANEMVNWSQQINS